jgi:hypothetical protein
VNGPDTFVQEDRVAAQAVPTAAKTSSKTKSFENFLLNPNSSFQYEHTQEKFPGIFF